MGLWAIWSSGRCPCSLQGRWAKWPLQVPSNPKHSMILWFQASVTLTGSSPWNCSGWSPSKIIPKWVETGNADQVLACGQLLSIRSPVTEEGIELAYGFPVFSPFLAFLCLLCSVKSFLGLFTKVISIWQWLTTGSEFILNLFPYPNTFLTLCLLFK